MRSKLILVQSFAATGATFAQQTQGKLWMQDEPDGSDEPAEASHNVQESAKPSQTIMPCPARDAGVTSGPPCASPNLGTYRTRSGRAVIRPARFAE